MRLLLVELDRFRSRRAIALLLIGAALLTALVAGATIYNTRPYTAAEVAAAEEQAAEAAKQPWVAEEVARCEQDPTRYGGDGFTTEQCVESVVPRAENFLWRPRLDLAEEVRGSGPTLAMLLAAVMVIAGTTFAGGDGAWG